MAAKEAYDYLPTKTATKNQTLTIVAQAGDCFERAFKNDVIHEAVDGYSEERIDFSDGNYAWYFYIPWKNMQAANSGTIMQFALDSDYGNGQINTWYLQYHDGHTYVARFATPWERVCHLGNLYSHMCLLKIVGKVVDS